MSHRLHGSAYLLASLLTLLLSCAGGESPDSLMVKSYDRGTPKEQETSLVLARYAGDGENPWTLRAWALRSLSRLRNHPAESVRIVGEIVRSPRLPSPLRTWAAYALGEMRSREGLPFLVEALNSNPDDQTAIAIMDALGKVVSLIVEDPEINTRLVQVMTSYAAVKKNEVPAIYDLLNEHVSNLVVLAVTLEALLSEDPSLHDSDTVYAAIFRTLSFMERSLEQLFNAYAQNRESMKRILEMSFSAVTPGDQALWLMVGWYAGVIGGRAEMADFCAGHMSEWLSQAPPPMRLVFLWSVARMNRYSDAASRLLSQRLLSDVDDPETLRMLGQLSNSPGQLDVLQQVFQVQIAPQEVNQ